MDLVNRTSATEMHEHTELVNIMNIYRTFRITGYEHHSVKVCGSHLTSVFIYKIRNISTYKVKTPGNQQRNLNYCISHLLNFTLDMSEPYI